MPTKHTLHTRPRDGPEEPQLLQCLLPSVMAAMAIRWGQDTRDWIPGKDACSLHLWGT